MQRPGWLWRCLESLQGFGLLLASCSPSIGWGSQTHGRHLAHLSEGRREIKRKGEGSGPLSLCLCTPEKSRFPRQHPGNRATSSCRGVWRQYCTGYIAALDRIRIPLGRRQGGHWEDTASLLVGSSPWSLSSAIVKSTMSSHRKALLRPMGQDQLLSWL